MRAKKDWAPAEAAGKGTLFMVGTPIGNLGDVSERARATLARVSKIYCEDTRVTKKLLSALSLHVPLERADEHALVNKVSRILQEVMDGANVAFVSDAGMPALSDPGQKLVEAALLADVHVEVIPGPTAAMTALVASGIACNHFYFYGFLPRKDGERLKVLESLAVVPGAFIFYESPHRVAKTLRDLAHVFPSRTVALCRELTKLHEEVVRATTTELAEKYKGKEVRGECVLVVSEAVSLEGAPKICSRDELKREARRLIVEDASISSVAKKLAKQTGISRNEAYVLLLEMQPEEKRKGQ